MGSIPTTGTIYYPPLISYGSGEYRKYGRVRQPVAGRANYFMKQKAYVLIEVESDVTSHPGAWQWCDIVDNALSQCRSITRMRAIKLYDKEGNVFSVATDWYHGKKR